MCLVIKDQRPEIVVEFLVLLAKTSLLSRFKIAMKYHFTDIFHGKQKVDLLQLSSASFICLTG